MKNMLNWGGRKYVGKGVFYAAKGMCIRVEEYFYVQYVGPSFRNKLTATLRENVVGDLQVTKIVKEGVCLVKLTTKKGKANNEKVCSK